MRSIILTLILIGTAFQEEPPPDQPHTNDPAQCTSYCYPEGYEGAKPKGTPEGIEGHACQGDHCARAANPEGGEEPCDEHGQERKCTKFCAKPCCTCLAVCL